MKASTRNRVKGMAKEAQGKLKETVGRVTRSARLQREGRAEATRGRVRRQVGELEKNLEDATNF